MILDFLPCHEDMIPQNSQPFLFGLNETGLGIFLHSMDDSQHRLYRHLVS